MNLSVLMTAMILISACSTPTPKFNSKEACSNQSLKYLRNPRNMGKKPLQSPALIQELVARHKDMQACYDEFRERTGDQEFNTCLVVGVDEEGKQEYLNFSSTEANVDQEFLDCAMAVTKKVEFEKYGKNYILIQSYKFFIADTL